MLNVLSLTIVVSAPLLLAAMGGFTSERAGVINIGLEGIMLFAGCVYALTSTSLGAWGGLGAGLGAAVALSLGHWLATQIYRIDHVISGMAVNALAIGGTNFLFGKFNDPSRSGGLSVLPPVLFLGAAYLLPPLLWAYVRFTRGGLRLQAVGSDPDKARLAGLSPRLIRLAGLVATGVFAGLGGEWLVNDNRVFTNNMTAGRGYIALAALILGGWRPLPTLGACLVFGFFKALSIQCLGETFAGVQPPSELWASLPYLATIVALAGFLGKSRTPAGLGKP